MKIWSVLMVIGLLCTSTMSWAQTSVFDTYLMVAHGCDQNDPSNNCADPAYHMTHLLESSDGTTWTDTTLEGSGSVPDVIPRGSYLYIYNPGQVTIIDRTTGYFSSSSSVSVTGSTGKAIDYVDPSLYYDSTAGLFVMFYLDATGITGDPAQCPDTDGDGLPDYPCTKEFRSATEVSGSNGTKFSQDLGLRYDVTITASDPVAQFASDPDIFRDGSQYVLLISRGQNTQVFTSPNLRGRYSPGSGLTQSVLVWGHGVASGHYDSATSEYWIYAHDNSSASVVRQAKTSTLGTALFISDFSTIVNGATVSENPLYYFMASPGFTENN